MGAERELCEEVETVRELTYLSERVRAGGGCEVAVSAITTCRSVELRDVASYCMERFPIKLKGAV